MAKKKFNRPKHKGQSAISKAKESIRIDSNSLISFSYKYFCVTEKFAPFSRDVTYFKILQDRLIEISKWTSLGLISDKSNSLRFHPIDWSKTTENSFGIPNEENVVSKPYQFSLSANKYGRVHGFMINSVFYIRWFDPDHNLYE